MLTRIAITLITIPLAVALAVLLIVCLVVGLVVAMFHDDEPWYTP